jgi:hypothetical protein
MPHTRTRELLALPLLHRQPILPVDAFDALVIVAPAFALQHPGQQRNAPSGMHRRQLAPPRAQRPIIPARVRDIVYGRSLHAQPPTLVPLRDPGSGLYVSDDCPPLCGRPQFFSRDILQHLGCSVPGRRRGA